MWSKQLAQLQIDLTHMQTQGALVREHTHTVRDKLQEYFRGFPTGYCLSVLTLDTVAQHMHGMCVFKCVLLPLTLSCISAVSFIFTVVFALR